MLNAAGCCLLAFSIGLLFVQRSGNYFVAMFDDYSATVPLLIVVVLENVAVAWVYGVDRYVLWEHRKRDVKVFSERCVQQCSYLSHHWAAVRFP